MVERGDADIAQGLDADMIATLKPGRRLALVEGPTMNFIYLADCGEVNGSAGRLTSTLQSRPV